MDPFFAVQPADAVLGVDRAAQPPCDRVDRVGEFFRRQRIVPEQRLKWMLPSPI